MPRRVVLPEGLIRLILAYSGPRCVTVEVERTPIRVGASPTIGGKITNPEAGTLYALRSPMPDEAWNYN